MNEKLIEQMTDLEKINYNVSMQYAVHILLAATIGVMGFGIISILTDSTSTFLIALTGVIIIVLLGFFSESRLTKGIDKEFEDKIIERLGGKK